MSGTFENVQPVRELSDLMQSHVEWRIRLRAAILNREVLDVSEIEHPDACIIGQWLLRNVTTLGIDLEPLKAYHAAFHAQAAIIARASNAGNVTLAESLLNPGSEFMHATSEFRNEIFRIEQRFDPTAQ